MKKYLELRLKDLAEGQGSLLIAWLSDLGFSGFLEEGPDLVAYAEAGSVDMRAVEQIIGEAGCSVEFGELGEQNWNQLWEESFEPVRVGKFVSIRADFHSVANDVEYEIVITPKMSFGTGHHATTWLMLEAIQGLRAHFSTDIRRVVDYGTGTGILAILAEKMGADTVMAIDNDAWSMANARENLARNDSTKAALLEAEEIPQDHVFDLVLANINKNVLLAQSNRIIDAMAPGGWLLLSGILQEDLPDILAAYQYSLGAPLFTRERSNWLVVAFRKAELQD